MTRLGGVDGTDSGKPHSQSEAGRNKKLLVVVKEGHKWKWSSKKGSPNREGGLFKSKSFTKISHEDETCQFKASRQKKNSLAWITKRIPALITGQRYRVEKILPDVAQKLDAIEEEKAGEEVKREEAEDREPCRISPLPPYFPEESLSRSLEEVFSSQANIPFSPQDEQVKNIIRKSFSGRENVYPAYFQQFVHTLLEGKSVDGNSTSLCVPPSERKVSPGSLEDWALVEEDLLPITRVQHRGKCSVAFTGLAGEIVAKDASRPIIESSATEFMSLLQRSTNGQYIIVPKISHGDDGFSLREKVAIAEALGAESVGFDETVVPAEEMAKNVLLSERIYGNTVGEALSTSYTKAVHWDPENWKQLFEGFGHLAVDDMLIGNQDRMYQYRAYNSPTWMHEDNALVVEEHSEEGKPVLLRVGAIDNEPVAFLGLVNGCLRTLCKGGVDPDLVGRELERIFSEAEAVEKLVPSSEEVARSLLFYINGDHILKNDSDPVVNIRAFNDKMLQRFPNLKKGEASPYELLKSSIEEGARKAMAGIRENGAALKASLDELYLRESERVGATPDPNYEGGELAALKLWTYYVKKRIDAMPPPEGSSGSGAKISSLK